jgi:hypothetical protein
LLPVKFFSFSIRFCPLQANCLLPLCSGWQITRNLLYCCTRVPFCSYKLHLLYSELNQNKNSLPAPKFNRRVFSGLEDNCQNTSQCVAGGSQNNVVCENGRCSCTSGFVQDQGNCRGITLQS